MLSKKYESIMSRKITYEGKKNLWEKEIKKTVDDLILEEEDISLYWIEMLTQSLSELVIITEKTTDYRLVSEYKENNLYLASLGCHFFIVNSIIEVYEENNIEMDEELKETIEHIPHPIYTNIAKIGLIYNRLIEHSLFDKYFDIIKRYSWKYRYIDSYEDRINEAYFILIKTLDYCNVKKIDENFGFWYFLNDKLYSYFSNDRRKYLDQKKYISNIDITEHKLNNIIIDKRQKIDLDIIKKEFVRFKEDYKKTLDAKKLIIFEGLYELEEPKKEIAKKINISQSNFTYHYNNLEQNFREYLESLGYDLASFR